MDNMTSLLLINSTYANHSTTAGTSEQGWLFTSCIFAIWFLLGVPPAIAILVATARSADLNKPYNWLISNAVIGDGLVLMVAVPLQIYHTQPSMLSTTILGCSFTAVASYSFPVVPIQAWWLVAVNRYLALHDMAKCEAIFTKPKILLINSAVWIFAFLIHAPHYTFLHAIGYESEELRICGIQLRGQFANILTMGLEMCLSLLLPYAITAYCNLAIYRKIEKHRQLLFKSTITSAVGKEFKNIVKLMTATALLPLALQTPVALVKLVPAAGAIEWLARVSIVLFIFGHVTSPYLIVFFLKPYREGVWTLVKNAARNFQKNKSNGIAPLISASGNRTSEL